MAGFNYYVIPGVSQAGLEEQSTIGVNGSKEIALETDEDADHGVKNGRVRKNAMT